MSEPYERSLDAAILVLKTTRDMLIREIAEYPGPISGCDAQFNRLLSDRTRISNAIRELQSQPFVPTPRMLEPFAGYSRH